MSDDPVGDQLVGWGRVLRLATRGRVTGRPASAAVGFVEEPDGALLVAAGDPSAGWALNLLSEPGCEITIGEASFAALAEPLDEPERATAVRELILKYGTPAERLGTGPAFRLRRI